MSIFQIYQCFDMLVAEWNGQRYPQLRENMRSDVGDADAFVKVSLIPSPPARGSLDFRDFRQSGVLQVSIFLKFGAGPGAALALADELVEYLMPDDANGLIYPGIQMTAPPRVAPAITPKSGESRFFMVPVFFYYQEV